MFQLSRSRIFEIKTKHSRDSHYQALSYMNLMMTIFFVCKFSRASCGVDYKRRNNKQVVYLDNDHDVRLFISGKNVTTLEIIDKFK